MSEVLFVGTGDAFGAGGRRQSAVLVRGERGTLLLDCGATTGSGLGELGVDRDEIETILVSHFHGDHFGGIPLLLLAALYQDNRKHAIHIAGPPDIENRVRTCGISEFRGEDVRSSSVVGAHNLSNSPAPMQHGTNARQRDRPGHVSSRSRLGLQTGPAH